GTAQAGAGLEAGLNITYERGKFRFMAKAGFCWGVGAKGKVSGEIDASLVVEFIKWVAYQLRHVNYQRLDFIGADAFQAISDIIYTVVLTGEKIENFLARSTAAISILAQEKYQKIKNDIEDSFERGKLTARINSNSSILKYATPEAKGALLYLLTENGIVDDLDPRNATSPISPDAWRLGGLPNRKQAIIRVFEWVQSKAEFNCVMQRVTPTISVVEIPFGDKAARTAEGKARVYGFLDAGEIDRDSLLGNRFTTSDYDNDLQRIYEQLPDKAPKGGRLVRNRVDEYFSQVRQSVAPEFYKPCNNPTNIICSPDDNDIKSIA
ncbi:hypothetical protein, partial [Chromohalobacter nigrandesensis]|uniref:hypothetical protein n=1 Tax=Chromohalobacter nigrandesensis TaxID=119863 RepID=UPI001FF2F986